jgi:hypothetical protein
MARRSLIVWPLLFKAWKLVSPKIKKRLTIASQPQGENLLIRDKAFKTFRAFTMNVQIKRGTGCLGG